MARSALFYNNQLGGFSTVEDMSRSTGNRFYVDSGAADNGDTNSYGQTPDAPFSTWDFAISQCTANNGDIIYLMPSHAENVTTATGINHDVAGVEVIGLGHGADTPTITFTAAAGSVTIGAASTVIRNVKFVANFAGGVTAGITIAAAGDDCTLDGLVFRDTSAANEFLIHITVATTVDELTIKKCNFITLAGTMSSSVFFTGTTSNLHIANNLWHVDCSGSVVDHLADVPTACVFLANDVVNIDTGAGLVIGLKSDGVATGYLRGNYLFGNKNDAEPLAATNDFVKLSNDAGNTIASSGRLPHPAAVAAVP